MKMFFGNKNKTIRFSWKRTETGLETKIELFDGITIEFEALDYQLETDVQLVTARFELNYRIVSNKYDFTGDWIHVGQSDTFISLVNDVKKMLFNKSLKVGKEYAIR